MVGHMGHSGHTDHVDYGSRGSRRSCVTWATWVCVMCAIWVIWDSCWGVTGVTAHEQMSALWVWKLSAQIYTLQISRCRTARSRNSKQYCHWITDPFKKPTDRLRERKSKWSLCWTSDLKVSEIVRIQLKSYLFTFCTCLYIIHVYTNLIFYA